MQNREKTIYEKELEAKKDKLRGELDLSNVAMKECSKRVEAGTEEITTLMSMQRVHSYILRDLSLLLRQDNNGLTNKTT